jgi:uncharacterized protein (DUF1778 family)
MSRRTSTKARSERVEVRVSRGQKALFQRAAELQGRTLPDFVIASLRDAAMRVIEETHAIRLGAAAQPGLRGGTSLSESTECTAQGDRASIS